MVKLLNIEFLEKPRSTVALVARYVHEVFEVFYVVPVFQTDSLSVRQRYTSNLSYINEGRQSTLDCAEAHGFPPEVFLAPGKTCTKNKFGPTDQPAPVPAFMNHGPAPPRRLHDSATSASLSRNDCGLHNRIAVQCFLYVTSPFSCSSPETICRLNQHVVTLRVK